MVIVGTDRDVQGMKFLSTLFNEKNKKNRAKAFRRLARLWGGGGYDPIGPPRSTDKYMEDLEVRIS